jgi:putative photosynthetic complex assembly protein 2
MHVVLAIVVCLLVWWVSTGLILRAVATSRAGERWVFLGATVGLFVGLYGTTVTTQMSSVAGAYLGFGSALLIWAWQEVAFLLGVVTGPNRQPCPSVKGWPRFWLAFKTVAYQELALLALAVAVVLPAWDSPNQTAAGTYLVLWLMRLSAKLNIYLGVKNFYESFLPSRLHYLLTYFKRRRFNPLFPLSILVSSLTAAWIWMPAFDHTTPLHLAAGASLVGSMLVLAILEHGLLMAPGDPAGLWRWARPAISSGPGH